MQITHKRNPAGGPGLKGAVIGGLPKNPNEVAARLQRRLSAFSLVMDVVCNDVEEMGRMASTLAAGFDLTDDQRHELDRIALRLFDAREVLG